MLEIMTIIFVSLLLFILLTPNAMHALLSLILVFINFSMLLFYLDVLFLAFSYILVYIGAICVLFLYIILLLHLRIFSIIHKANLLLLCIVLSLSIMAFFSYSSYFTSFNVSRFSTFMLDINILSSYLFNTHTIHLIFAIFLLLLALVLAIFLSTSINESFINSFIFSANDSTNSPYRLRSIIKRYGDWVQLRYENILERLINYRLTRPLVKLYIGTLLLFRIYCNILASKIPHLHVVAVIISMVCSRLHVAGYMIIICLFIIRLNQSFNRVAKYYKKRPTQLALDFPQTQSNRFMWKQAGQVIMEAAENPMVQATAIAVTGALAWKTLDVIESGRNLESTKTTVEGEATQREKDRESAAEQAALAREAENQRHRESLEAENQRHRKSLEAENQRHRESLAAEAEQRRLDRESAERNAGVNKDSSFDSVVITDDKSECVMSSVYEDFISFDMSTLSYFINFIFNIYIINLILVIFLSTSINKNFINSFIFNTTTTISAKDNIPLVTFIFATISLYLISLFTVNTV